MSELSQSLRAFVRTRGTVADVSTEQIRVDTAMHATLAVSPFQRVLISGLVPGGKTEIDANLETCASCGQL